MSQELKSKCFHFYCFKYKAVKCSLRFFPPFCELCVSKRFLKAWFVTEFGCIQIIKHKIAFNQTHSFQVALVKTVNLILFRFFVYNEQFIIKIKVKNGFLNELSSFKMKQYFILLNRLYLATGLSLVFVWKCFWIIYFFPRKKERSNCNLCFSTQAFVSFLFGT